MTNTKLNTSRASFRRVRYESEVALQVLDVIFSSQTPEELAKRLQTEVLGHPNWNQIPRYRQSRIDAYTQGALDAIARINGQSPSVAPVERVEPKTPPNVQALQPDAKWARHVRGGGWVSDTAKVAPTAYVGPNALVYDHATVSDKARVYASAQVFGHAMVSGSAAVHGHARVHGHAQVSDHGRVAGNAEVAGIARIEGDYQVKDAVKLGITAPPSIRPSMNPTPVPSFSGRSPLASLVPGATAQA